MISLGAFRIATRCALVVSLAAVRAAGAQVWVWGNDPLRLPNSVFGTWFGSPSKWACPFPVVCTPPNGGAGTVYIGVLAYNTGIGVPPPGLPIDGVVTLDGNASVGALRLGNAARGQLIVSRYTLTSADIIVGTQSGRDYRGVLRSGVGQLDVSGGGVVVAATDVDVGSGANTSGAISVTGTGSRLSAGRNLTIGNVGPGTLTVFGGGRVDAAKALLGYQPGSQGTVTVSGAGSRWDVGTGGTNGLWVGGSGRGTLSIDNGGVVNGAGLVLVGALPASQGSITVSGSGSQVNVNGGALYIGRAAGSVGSLTMSGGAQGTSTSELVIGSGAGARGTATLTGVGTGFRVGSGPATAVQYLAVGASGGQGSLVATAGARVTSTLGFVGVDAGSVGSAVVSGAGSGWTTLDYLAVGAGGGQGSLSISAGGQVRSKFGFVGVDPGSVGSALVSGAGSAWTTSDFMAVGTGGGRGSLTISAGAQVGSLWGLVGAGAGSLGNVLVTGTGSQWTAAGALAIGSGGSGAVKVANNGRVSAGSVTVGSQGTLDIDPATVDVAGDFTLLAGGTLSIGVAGAAPGLFSQLLIGGVGLFQGNIFVNFMNGFAPSAGQAFSLITAAGGADFGGATVSVGGVGSGFVYSTAFTNGTWTFTALTDATATPEPSSIALTLGGLALLASFTRRRRA